jgi:hypothetical protein
VSGSESSLFLISSLGFPLVLFSLLNFLCQERGSSLNMIWYLKTENVSASLSFFRSSQSFDPSDLYLISGEMDIFLTGDGVSCIRVSLFMTCLYEHEVRLQ